MILGEPIANGGQEKFLLNMLSHMDRERVVFDIFSPFEIENEKTAEAFRELGCEVTALALSFTDNKKANFTAGTESFLDENKYPIIHIHSGSTYELMKGAELARKSGAKRVIVHSHCGGFADLRYRVIKAMSYFPLLDYPTDYFACSHLAAAWKFPRPVIKKKKYTVIKNAVDLSVFKFDSELRQKYRRELGLSDNLVLGHIGRFALQKNHLKLIDIFDAVLKQRPDARLLLAGEGETFDQTMQKADCLGIKDKIIYLGVRSDVAALMNAMDVFVLPSFFEGLPIVGVEAQATGLPVVTSTGVTRELPIEDLAEYVELDAAGEVWAEYILKSALLERRDTAAEITEAGYEINSAAKALQETYEGMI